MEIVQTLLNISGEVFGAGIIKSIKGRSSGSDDANWRR